MRTGRLHYWSLKCLNLVGLTLVVFALPYLMPGSTLALYVAWPDDRAQHAQLVADYALDRPLPYQYGRWLWRIVTGEWGQSRFYPRSVASDVWAATGRTLVLLAWTASAFGLCLLGQWGWRQWRPQAKPNSSCLTLLTFLAVLPGFIVALIGRETLAWQLGWISMAHLPTFAPMYMLNPLYMLLPAAVLALTPSAIWLAAASAAEARQRFALWLRPLLGHFLVQVFLTEQVLSMPGLGMVGLVAFKRRDIPLVQGFFLCAGILYLVLQIVADWQSHRQQDNAPHPALASDALTNPHSPHRLYSGLYWLAILIALAIWAPQLSSHDPTDIHSSDQLRYPGYRYLLGTDFLGRDVLSRTLEGFRSSIPCAFLVVGGAGGLGGALLGLRYLLPPALRWGVGVGIAMLQALPLFLLTFVAFLIVEPHAWALEIALVIGCTPLAYQLLATPKPWRDRMLSLAQIGAHALLITGVFRLLNIVSDSSIPTWGADIRFGMRYSQSNVWLLLAPSLALMWSYYSFYRLAHTLPTVASNQPDPDDGHDQTNHMRHPERAEVKVIRSEEGGE
jgi:peptide/nickel transport system permease protein